MRKQVTSDEWRVTSTTRIRERGRQRLFSLMFWLVTGHLSLVTCALRAQVPALTTVKDTVYKSDGSPASGTVVITWQGFVSADSRPVFGGNKTLPLTNGALAVALVPNAGGTPSGTSYRVRYYQSGGVYFEETWVVPGSSPLSSPDVPTVTPQGSTGSTTYCYWISATNTNGETLLGSTTCIANGNAALDGTNYNQVAWTAVSGATGYRVYRTPNQNAPSGTGSYLAGSTASTTLNDQSSSLSTTSIPEVNTTDPRTLSAVRVTAAPSTSVMLAPSQVTGTSIVSNPSSTQTITAPSSSGIPLQITGRSNNNSNVFEIYDSQASPQLKSYFNPSGALVSAQAPTFSAMTPGSLLFAGSGGLLSQDNTRLFWDNAAKSLQVGPRTGFSTVIQDWYLPYYNNTFSIFNSSASFPRPLGVAIQDTLSSSVPVGIMSVVDSAHASGNRAGATASSGDAYHSGSGTIGALAGVRGYVENMAGAGGNASQIVGVSGLAWHTGASTTTDAIGLLALSNGKSAGTVTNNYGIKVENQNIAGANNWAIKTGLGKVELGDSLIANAKLLNNIRFVDQFPGTDAGAKIAAAITDLPSTGGTVDGRGLEGSQTGAATLTFNKPVKLILGAMTYSYTGTGCAIEFASGSNGSAIEGIAGGTTITSTSGEIICFDASVHSNLTLEGFIATTSGSGKSVITLGAGSAITSSQFLNLVLVASGGNGSSAIKVTGSGNLVSSRFESLRAFMQVANATTAILHFIPGSTGAVNSNEFQSILLQDTVAGNSSLSAIYISPSGSGHAQRNTFDGVTGEGLNAGLYYEKGASANGLTANNKLSNVWDGDRTATSTPNVTVSDYAYYTVLDNIFIDSGNPGIPPVSESALAVAPIWIGDGNVGIGTATPSVALDIQGGLLNVGNSGADGSFTEVFRTGLAGYTGTANWRNSIYSSVSSTPLSSKLKFSLANAQTTQADVMTLQGNGDIVASTNVISPQFTSSAADPADAGVVRLGNDEVIAAEAAPTGTDGTFKYNSSEQWEMNSPLTVTGSVTASKALVSHLEAVTFSTTPTFDAALGNSFKMTLTGNVTSSTITNPQTGQFMTLLLCQDGTGSRTMTWPANLKLAGGAFTLTTTLNKCDSITAVYDGTNWYETARAANL